MVWIARIVASLVCLMLVLPSGWAFAEPSWQPLAPAPKTTTTRSTAVSRSATAASPADGRSYAQREARHPEAADFRGGDSFGVYIGGSAGLLVVILLVLLLLR